VLVVVGSRAGSAGFEFGGKPYKARRDLPTREVRQSFIIQSSVLLFLRYLECDPASFLLLRVVVVTAGSKHDPHHTLGSTS